MITKSEFNTDPHIIKTDKLLQKDETPEEHRKELVTLEKNCEFKEIEQEDSLISDFVTSVTDKKLWENLLREKTLNIKTKTELTYNNSYDPQHKQSTIPPALAKDKKIKQGPIQTLQTGQNRNYTKTKLK